jgi:hypothetical protein
MIMAAGKVEEEEDDSHAREEDEAERVPAARYGFDGGAACLCLGCRPAAS